MRDVVLSNIQHRLTPRSIRVRADIEVTCFAYDGIDSIKTALRAGIVEGNDDHPIILQLVAPPHYVLHITSSDQEKSVQILNNAIDKIKNEIVRLHGEFVLKNPPRSVTENDEKKLAIIMDELTRVNTEVDGDDDNSDEEADSGGIKINSAEDEYSTEEE